MSFEEKTSFATGTKKYTISHLELKACDIEGFLGHNKYGQNYRAWRPLYILMWDHMVNFQIINQTAIGRSINFYQQETGG